MYPKKNTFVPAPPPKRKKFKRRRKNRKKITKKKKRMHSRQPRTVIHRMKEEVVLFFNKKSFPREPLFRSSPKDSLGFFRCRNYHTNHRWPSVSGGKGHTYTQNPRIVAVVKSSSPISSEQAPDSTDATCFSSPLLKTENCMEPPNRQYLLSFRARTDAYVR